MAATQRNVAQLEKDGVTLLGSSLPVPFSAAEGKLTLQPPAVNPGNMPCEFAWTFKIANPQE